MSAAGRCRGAPETRFESVVLGGARAFGQVGAWNPQALEKQARTGLLFTPGRSLTGEGITDKPELIEAKLKGRAVRIPVERVDHIRAAYATVRASSVAGARVFNRTSPPGTDRTLER